MDEVTGAYGIYGDRLSGFRFGPIGLSGSPGTGYPGRLVMDLFGIRVTVSIVAGVRVPVGGEGGKGCRSVTVLEGVGSCPPTMPSQFCINAITAHARQNNITVRMIHIIGVGRDGTGAGILTEAGFCPEMGSRSEPGKIPVGEGSRADIGSFVVGTGGWGSVIGGGTGSDASVSNNNVFAPVRISKKLTSSLFGSKKVC